MILATHHLHILPDCEDIVLLDKGCVVAHGVLGRISENACFKAYTGALTEASSKDDLYENENEPRHMRELNLQQPSSPIILDEDRALRNVKWAVIREYLEATGSVWNVPFIIIWSWLSQGLVVFTGLWLAWWVSDYFPTLNTGQYIGIYAGLTVFAGIFSYGFATTMQFACTRASNAMSQAALRRIFVAPMSFFESQPVGRILSRFTHDVAMLDDFGTIHLKVCLLAHEPCEEELIF